MVGLLTIISDLFPCLPQLISLLFSSAEEWFIEASDYKLSGPLSSVVKTAAETLLIIEASTLKKIHRSDLFSPCF